MIDKRLFKLPKAKIMLAMLAGLMFLQAFAILGQGIFLARAIVGSWKQQPFTEIAQDVLLFLIFYLLRQGINWFQKWYMNRYANQTTTLLRQQLLNKTYDGGIALVSRIGTGNLVSTLLDGMDEISNYLSLIFPKLIALAIVPWVILIYIFTLNALSGWILLLVFPLLILFMIILGTAAQSKASKQYAGYVKLQNHFVDALRGLSTLKVLGLARRYGNIVYKNSENYRKKTMGVLRVAILSTFTLDFFTTLSIAMIAMFLGIGLINGNLVLYPSLVILILSPEYFLPIRDFGNDFHATLNGKNALGQIFDILAFPTTPQEDQLSSFTWNKDSAFVAKNLAFNYSHVDQSEFSVNKNAKMSGVVKKKSKPKVNKHTADELRNINLSLTGFQKVGIIGPTGAGKTTLMRILAGFLTPHLKDDNFTINGQNLAQLNQKSWQNQITYIPQDPYMFASSIRDNLTFYNPNASQEEIDAALKATDLDNFVASLKDGLNTRIGENGRGISGGQKQRIALARAFLAKDRKILFFDEPTAHLDIETEYELKQPMKKLMENHLVFFTTHRLHWLNDMDWCLVIENGEIVEQGTPADLAKNGTAFKKLTQPLKEDLL